MRRNSAALLSAAIFGLGLTLPRFARHFKDAGADAGSNGGTAAATPAANAATPADNAGRKPLRDEFNELRDAAAAMLATAEAEGRDLNESEQAENDKQFKRMETIRNLLDRQSKLAGDAFSGNLPTVQKPAVPGNKSPEQAAVEIVVGETKFSKAEVKKAINNWARTGELDRRFATITTATNSALLLPVDVAPPIVPSAMNTFREALSVYGLDAWKTPTTRQINLPIVDATAGGVISETASSETENAPGLSNSIKSIPKGYQSGSVWFSMLEMMAQDFDLMDATLPSLQYSKELGLENDVIAAATTGIINDAGITQSVATATVTGFTYANLVTLNRALPKKFNAQKVIILSKSAYTAAENLTTTTGFPILNALDPQRSSLKFFNGTPVLWSDYFSTFAANNVVGCIFSWIGVRVRDCGEQYIQRFTQNQARPGQQGYNLYGFHAINYSPEAIATLKCPAS